MKNKKRIAKRIAKIVGITGAGIAGLALLVSLGRDILTPLGIERAELKKPIYLDRAKQQVEYYAVLDTPIVLDKTLEEEVKTKVGKVAPLFELGGVEPEKVSDEITEYLQNDNVFYAHLKESASQDVADYIASGFSQGDFSLKIKDKPNFRARHDFRNYRFELDYKGDDIATFGAESTDDGKYNPVNIKRESCPAFEDGVKKTIKEKSVPRALSETKKDLEQIARNSLADFGGTLKEKVQGIANSQRLAQAKSKVANGFKSLTDKIPQEYKDSLKKVGSDLRTAGEEAGRGAKKFLDGASEYFKN